MEITAISEMLLVVNLGSYAITAESGTDRVSSSVRFRCLMPLTTTLTAGRVSLALRLL